MPASRIQWLDGARAVLMLLGVALHAADVFAEPNEWLVANDAGHPAFNLLVWFIHAFRMPAFFIIAGFFCAYSYRRFRPAGFLRSRLAKIGLPLAATALTFNLWQDIFLSLQAGSADTLAGYFTDGHIGVFFTQGLWQSHLWFLTYLVLYHLAYAALAPAMQCLGLADLADRIATPSRQPLLASPYLLALLCIGPPALADLVPALWETVFAIFTGYHLLFYVPYFAFGAAAYRWRAMLDGFCRFRALDLPMLAGALLIAYDQPELTGTDLDDAIHVYAYGLSAWLLARLVFVACRAAVSTGRIVAYLSDASFSVYLVHHLLVVLGGWLVAQLALPIVLEYFALVAGVCAIALALHHVLVLRHPLLRLLFNGRPPARQAPLRSAPPLPIIARR